MIIDEDDIAFDKGFGKFGCFAQVTLCLYFLSGIIVSQITNSRNLYFKTSYICFLVYLFYMILLRHFVSPILGRLFLSIYRLLTSPLRIYRNLAPTSGSYQFSYEEAEADYKKTEYSHSRASSSDYSSYYSDDDNYFNEEDSKRFQEEVELENKKILAAYKTLGLSIDATADQIKKAHRSLMKAHHPDLVANSNPSSQKEANKRTREIQAAYELLVKMRS